jgi:hypothetical protein
VAFPQPTILCWRSFHIHLRGFFSSITAHVAAAVIPPSATSSKISSGVPICVIFATRVRPLARIQVRSVLPAFSFGSLCRGDLGRLCRGAPHGRLSSVCEFVNTRSITRSLADQSWLPDFTAFWSPCPRPGTCSSAPKICSLNCRGGGARPQAISYGRPSHIFRPRCPSDFPELRGAVGPNAFGWPALFLVRYLWSLLRWEGRAWAPWASPENAHIA